MLWLQLNNKLSGVVLKYYHPQRNKGQIISSYVFFHVSCSSAKHIKQPPSTSCLMWCSRSVRQILTAQTAPLSNTYPCTIYFCVSVCCFRWPRRSWRGWRAATGRQWEMQLRLGGSTRRPIKVGNPGIAYFSKQNRFHTDGIVWPFLFFFAVYNVNLIRVFP